MTRPGGRIALLGGLAVVALLPAPWGQVGRSSLHVPAGASLQAAIDSAPPGATIRLGAGEHAGPVTIGERVNLEGPRAAVVEAGPGQTAITVRADGVRLSGFWIAGGDTGIRVRDAEDVHLTDLLITGAAMEGIDVADAHASISRVEVDDLRGDLAQGIEVRNAEHRGWMTIEDSFVTGGQEGIVAHVARVRIENNVVRETTMHGISITEMSKGIAADNVVEDAAGAGLYCGDMSLCEFRGNEVAEVRATGMTRSLRGWGLLVHYHSSASSHSNNLAGEAGSIGVFDRSHLRARSPLRLGRGWAGLTPALWVVPLALVALVAAYLVARGSVARSVESPQRDVGWVMPLILVGVAVQSFHMLEHFLQVYRVHFDGVPSRGGVVGPVVEAEWIHLGYNLLVFSSLALVLWSRRRGWPRAGATARADGLLGAAAIVQGYHVVEHVSKVIQHVSTGAKVNPGILGGRLDLVWFHFGINLTVYIAFVGAAALYVAPVVRRSLRMRIRAAAASVKG